MYKDRQTVRLAKITTPHFENPNCKFYHAQIPKAAKNETINNLKTTQKCQRFEKISLKQGLVLMFGHVT